MKVEKKIFIPSVLILLIIVALVFTNLEHVQSSVGAVYDFFIAQFGWLFIIADLSCLVFALWIMLGPYKNIRLGGEDCKPAFSTASWAGMMFTTSCGGWLVVYGFLEPLYCASASPFEITPLTTEAYEFGQAFAHFHWGPNAWCIYVPVTVAIGYMLYNRAGKKGNISNACASVFGTKAGKAAGYMSDLFSVLAAAIAPVISIGTGMPLLVAIVENLFGISDEYRTTIQISILAIWILIFGTSVFLGLQKGIKRLSNTNIIMAFIIMGIVGLFYGLFKVFAAEINTFGVLTSNYVRMSTYTDPFGSGSFVRGWTISYWACYFVYMPLMGVFNAKISKGRRLKEIAFGQLVLCTLGCWVAMSTFGNYAMGLQVDGKVNIADYLANGDEAGAIIAIASQMPASKIMLFALLVIVFVFLATTMDSSAFSAAELTSKVENGESLAPRWLRVTWATIAAILTFALLQVGGAKAVRSICYIMGLPLAIISFFIIASAIKMLRQDHSKECETSIPLKIFKRD